ncbi:MAG: hypothetical protein PHF84_02470 [bacterium]|nr:hypothetical protein [bacterium]
MKVKVLLFLAMMLSPITYLSSTPCLPGSTGTATMPTTPAMGQGNLFLGVHYITGEPTTVVNLGYGLTPKWELTGAFESEDTEPAPFFHLGTKYNYYEGGSINSSFGLGMTHSSGLKDSKFSIYNVIGSSAFSGLFSVGIGYTFDESSYLNFWMGFSAEIFREVLYFESDFSNFPYRYFGSDFANPYRGIVNMLLRLKLGQIVTIDMGSLDILDTNREFCLGIQLRVSL